jgi:hypothetical protein
VEVGETERPKSKDLKHKTSSTKEKTKQEELAEADKTKSRSLKSKTSSTKEKTKSEDSPKEKAKSEDSPKEKAKSADSPKEKTKSEEVGDAEKPKHRSSKRRTSSTKEKEKERESILPFIPRLFDKVRATGETSSPFWQSSRASPGRAGLSRSLSHSAATSTAVRTGGERPHHHHKHHSHHSHHGHHSHRKDEPARDPDSAPKDSEATENVETPEKVAEPLEKGPETPPKTHRRMSTGSSGLGKDAPRSPRNLTQKEEEARRLRHEKRRQDRESGAAELERTRTEDSHLRREERRKQRDVDKDAAEKAEEERRQRRRERRKSEADVGREERLKRGVGAVIEDGDGGVKKGGKERVHEKQKAKAKPGFGRKAIDSIKRMFG